MNLEELDDKNIMVMKLLHYFITEKNYNPIILQGVENEIWLENLTEEYQVIRIVSGYIHNDYQFDFDKFKTKRILKKIKKKTLSIGKMTVISFFLNLNDTVKMDGADNNNLFIKVTDEGDLKDNSVVNKAFPDLVSKLKFTEKGMELFMKITGDINKHNKEDAKKVEKVFKSKFPLITYILIAFNVICYFIPLVFNESNVIADMFCVHGPSIRAGQYYRLITGAFLHGGFFHLLFNCYALYIIGSQLESFLGKFKYSVIYFVSMIFGSLMSMIFNGAQGSLGASGAIFGLMGSLLYFGYYYRVYLGNVAKSQILPLILVNLLFGFVSPGIDNAAHIGGLLGGVLITMSLGVKDKTSLFEKINGWIVTALILVFLGFMAFIYSA